MVQTLRPGEKKDAGTPYQCGRCDAWKHKDDFAPRQFARGHTRLCEDCAGEAEDEREKKLRAQCSECKHEKPRRLFSDRQWRKSPDEGRTCQACEKTLQKQCSACKEMKPREQFSDRQWRKAEGRRCETCGEDAETRQCDECKERKSQSGFSDWQWRKEAGSKDGRTLFG